MKIKQITESTYENLSVLEKLANIIIDNTPKIPFNTTKKNYTSQV